MYAESSTPHGTAFLAHGLWGQGLSAQAAMLVMESGHSREAQFAQTISPAHEHIRESARACGRTMGLRADRIEDEAARVAEAEVGCAYRVPRVHGR